MIADGNAEKLQGKRPSERYCDARDVIMNEIMEF